MEEPIITFRTYTDPVLAHIERTRLEDNGVPCFVDDSIMNIYPSFGNSPGGITLKIFERDIKKAETILAEDAGLQVEELTGPDAAITVCPYCGSNNVRYSLAVPDDANWLTRTIATLFNALPFDKDKDWHCFNCGEDF